MIPDNSKSQVPYAQPYTGPVVQAQPVPVQQGAGVQQPQVIYAQPVNPQVQHPIPSNQWQQDRYTVVERQYYTNATYCGPITILLALVMFWFIGPFVLFFFLCPCDQVPEQTVTRTEYRDPAGANYA